MGHNIRIDSHTAGRLILAALFMLSVTPAHASGGGGGGGTCTLAIAWNSGYPLQFGTFAAPTSGTLSVGTGADTVSKTGGVLLMGGDVGRARFTLTCPGTHGGGGSNYAITLSSSTSLSNGASSMTVDAFQSSPTSGYINQGTSVDVYVGATLNPSTNQEAGSYSGTFDVTVNYP